MFRSFIGYIATPLKNLIYLTISLSVIFYFVYLISDNEKNSHTNLIAFQKSEKLFTGIGVTTFSEFRVNDQLPYRLHITYSDGYVKDPNGEDILLKNMIQEYIKNVENPIDDSLHVVTLGQLKDLYCKGRILSSTRIAKDCHFMTKTKADEWSKLSNDQSISSLELYIPLTKYDEYYTWEFYKKDYDDVRHPYTKGGMKIFDKLLSASSINKDESEDDDYIGNPIGYCEKRYIVGFGYNNFNDFFNSDKLKDIDILTTNTLQTKVIAMSPDFATQVTEVCDKFDYSGSFNDKYTRQDHIKNFMSEDALKYQQDHAKAVHSFIKKQKEISQQRLENKCKWLFCLDNFFINTAHATESNSNELGAHLGSLAVTATTYYGATNKHWFSSNKIYLRKDVSRSYFGSFLTETSLAGRHSWFDSLFQERPIKTFTFSDPGFIAMDRYIDGIFVSKGFKFSDSTIATSFFNILLGRDKQHIKTTKVEENINDEIMNTLEGSENLITNMAKKNTKEIMTRYYKNIYPDHDIRIEFD